ncbi:MAG: hypothetical protein JW715_04600 [Sedimentisphaerales bacterium]|nr:hypothetical protein [Sedimentisphaerales bacterium]
MSGRLILIFLAVTMCLISSVDAADIVWVSEAGDEPVDGQGDGILDDQTWIDLITAYGHNVYSNPGTWTELDPNQIELLNNADLVIFSRNSNSSGYAGNTDEVTQWNSITSPMILMNAYLVRSSRWRWINSTAMGGLETQQLSTYYPAVDVEVEDLEHPIFSGTILDENNWAKIMDPNADSGNISIIATDNVGNGKLIATLSDQDWAYIAEWEAGVEFYPGSNQIPADRRLYFAAGAQAVTDGYGGAYNLTEQGLQVFLKAIDYMLGIEPRAEAFLPEPADNQQEVLPETGLNWLPGVFAHTHDVYLGKDRKAVNNADRDNPMDVLIAQGLTDSSYTPAEPLEYGQTYYWKIDENSETDPASPWKGDLWSFTVRNYLVVDDFESYNDLNVDEEGSRRVFLIWIDGYDNPTVNGSTMGYPDPDFANDEHFVEAEIVRSGAQSGPIFFNNMTASYSEVTISTAELLIGGNWAAFEPERLSLWVYGDPNNPATESMYIKVNDLKAPLDPDLTLAQWQELSIDLATLGADLSNVTTLTIGFESTGATGSSGGVLVDDIRLYRPAVPTPLEVENYSFEQPGTGKLKSWDTVPGWNSDTPPSDSGVESAGPRFPPSDGDWSAFLMGSDPSIWQLTGNIIEASAEYILTVDAENNYGATQLKMSMYYDDGSGNRIELAAQTVDLLDGNNDSSHNMQDKVEFSLTFSADDVPEAIGQKLGIEFDNTLEGWIGLDNICLFIL